MDIVGNKLWRLESGDNTVTSWDTPRFPACLALSGQDELLVTGRSWSAQFDAARGAWRDISTTGIDFNSERFNDGRVDARGRWWVGSMDRHLKSAAGGIYCLQRPWHWQRLRDGIGLGNGLGWSPDGRWMYITDTWAKTIYRHGFDAQSGRIEAGTPWVVAAPGEGGPDGLTVDAEGFVWSAQFDRAAIHRYAPDGTLVSELALPVQRPTSVTFGGAALRTLYVTTACMGLSDADLAAHPLSGHLLSLPCDVSGMREHLLGSEPEV